MSDEPVRPLVVLGLPRTGTTWMAGAVTVGVGGPYLHEPFNASLDKRHHRWAMRVLGRHDLADFGRAVDDAWAPIGTGPCPVMKDVHALFALSQLARARGLPVVVAVRHPCAMANSWQELGWTGPGLDRLLDQTGLLAAGGTLGPWADHLRSCAGDADAEFGATWGATLTLLDHLRSDRTVYLVHEEMCVEPSTVVRTALDEIGVALSGDGGRPAVEAWLAERDGDGGDQQSQVRRTAEQPDRWRTTLAPDRAARVMAGAQPFGHLQRFYSATSTA